MQTKDNESLEKIAKKYHEQVSDESESYNYLEKEKCILLDLSKSQAAKLENMDEIDFLERDLKVQGSSEDKVMASECEDEWNIKMVNGDVKEDAASEKEKSIKVAIIDSGIDYTDGIHVAQRKDFISDGEEINILYEDFSGHGTSVAGVIAASGKENEEIAGIAPNVELYSVKVLNANNTAPISRVAEGIYWAMDQHVDIINLSFGTDKSSELLKKAVKDAYPSNVYKNGFKLVAFTEFAQATKSAAYSENKENFNNINLNISDIVEY